MKVGDMVEYNDDGEIFFGEVNYIDEDNGLVGIDVAEEDGQGNTELIEFALLSNCITVE